MTTTKRPSARAISRRRWRQRRRPTSRHESIGSVAHKNALVDSICRPSSLPRRVTAIDAPTDVHIESTTPTAAMAATATATATKTLVSCIFLFCFFRLLSICAARVFCGGDAHAGRLQPPPAARCWRESATQEATPKIGAVELMRTLLALARAGGVSGGGERRGCV